MTFQSARIPAPPTNEQPNDTRRRADGVQYFLFGVSGMQALVPLLAQEDLSDIAGKGCKNAHFLIPQDCIPPCGAIVKPSAAGSGDTKPIKSRLY